MHLLHQYWHITQCKLHAFPSYYSSMRMTLHLRDIQTRVSEPSALRLLWISEDGRFDWSFHGRRWLALLVDITWELHTCVLGELTSSTRAVLCTYMMLNHDGLPIIHEEMARTNQRNLRANPSDKVITALVLHQRPYWLNSIDLHDFFFLILLIAV